MTAGLSTGQPQRRADVRGDDHEVTEDVREEKRLLPVRGPRAQQTLSDPARLAPTVPGGGRQPWKGGLRSSTRPRVEEVSVQQEAQGCRCLSRGWGGVGRGPWPFPSSLGFPVCPPTFLMDICGLQNWIWKSMQGTASPFACKRGCAAGGQSHSSPSPVPQGPWSQPPA